MIYVPIRNYVNLYTEYLIIYYIYDPFDFTPRTLVQSVNFTANPNYSGAIYPVQY